MWFKFSILRQLAAFNRSAGIPRSTLLMLVSTFAGQENIRKSYQAAIENEYRFFSYGDAMLITRR